MIYWISKENGKKLTFNQLQYCLMRNFSGQTDNKTVILFLERLSAHNVHVLLTEHSTADVKVRDYSLLCNLCYYL